MMRRSSCACIGQGAFVRHARRSHTCRFPSGDAGGNRSALSQFYCARTPEIELCEVVSIKATIVRKQSVGVQLRESSNEKVRNDPATAASLT
ncbi:MAG: hypothetical protein DME51_12550 [Verrucomicrobia bacterium]|nr:MAG: hypothetical protein DME51_12550 [Verrucomicrobiota bacterium]